MKKNSFTIVPIKDNDNIVKARVLNDGDKKEFFVFAISKDDLSKLENSENNEIVRNLIPVHQH